ncbi:hypothetical protein [Listeria booriae]|uniref:Uncharacterized protein n=1 Tax=Listeria booriae TaxID=1552123 RepID=A0A7X1DSR5_9LIST|nr:hypothetical protein [Listeria booriae]MBC1228788.1 hypothetical protein [Listeria booriae]MBC1318445.1 hypothetical protein [Listeria booriae]MBC1333463.1 hypothetical protein [Listeria booriae]MBC2373629.1 hypothetical protein [Listeria booriae]MBC2388768.1 hypothetical protein [Listeria booriae]
MAPKKKDPVQEKRYAAARKKVDEILKKSGRTYADYEFQQNVNFIFDHEAQLQESVPVNKTY